jgi:hypothetical protein
MREEELLAVPEGGYGGEAALAFPAPLPQQEGQRRHRRVSCLRRRGLRGCAGGFHSSFPWWLRLGTGLPVGQQLSTQHSAPSRPPPRFPRGAERKAQCLVIFDPFIRLWVLPICRSVSFSHLKIFKILKLYSKTEN